MKMLRGLETWLREGRENQRTRGIGVDMALISVEARGDPTSVAVTGGRHPSTETERDTFSGAISVQKFGCDLLLLDVLLKGEWREPKRAFVPERQLVDAFRGFNVWRVDEPAAQCSENNHILIPEPYIDDSRRRVLPI